MVKPARPLNDTDNHHIVIVGAGPVGCMMALALAEQGYACSIIERQASIATGNTSFDGRCLALNLQSWQLIQKSITSALNPQSIKQIRISQHGHFGSTLLDSEQMNLSQFGVTVDSIKLGEALHHAVQNHQLIQAYFGVDEVCFENAARTNHIRQITFQHQQRPQQLLTKLVIAADGSHSSVRQHLKIASKKQDYQQTACLAKIQHEKPHYGLAHQRFLENGILALLPTALKPIKDNLANDIVHPGYVSSLVLLQPTERLADYLELADDTFLNKLHALFGQGFGRWTHLTQRKSYPMQENLATTSHLGNSVLIGNAAHSLHPVAGQGLNLGLRDVQVLMENLHEHGVNVQAFTAFNQRQQHDILLMSRFVNGLLRLFANNQPGLASARAIGLKLFDSKPHLKQLLCYYMCGLFPESYRITQRLMPENWPLFDQLPKSLQNTTAWVENFVDEVKKSPPAMSNKLATVKQWVKTIREQFTT